MGADQVISPSPLYSGERAGVRGQNEDVHSGAIDERSSLARLVDAFMESITDEPREELAALADRLWKWSNDGHRLVGWLDEISMTDHPEAAQVYFLMNLLYELGLT